MRTLEMREIYTKDGKYVATISVLVKTSGLLSKTATVIFDFDIGKDYEMRNPKYAH